MGMFQLERQWRRKMGTAVRCAIAASLFVRRHLDMTICTWTVVEFTKVMHRSGLILSVLLLTWATPGGAQPISPPPTLVPIYPNIPVQAPKPPPEKPVPSLQPSPAASQPSSGAIVSGNQTQNAFGVQALACTPPSAPNELVELARALKWNPDLIYEYVHNNIKTIPIYDSLKGPLGTLLDGAGTPVDQTELTYTLLQQSCFLPQYQVGMIFLTAAQLDKWLGTATTIDANQYISLGTILETNGFCTLISFSPYTCHGYQAYAINGILTGADVPWIWVSVPINGTTYQFDPASKIFPNNGGDGYYPYSAGLGANLATALGYNQSSFLNGARTGATGIGRPALTFAQAGRNSVRNNLAQYANNLVSYIKGSTNSAATTTDIIGGSTIQPLPTYTPPVSGNTLWGQTALPYPNLQGIPPTTPGSLSAFRTTLTLTLGWNDQNNTFTPLVANPVTFNSADLHGHRLVIQFNASNVASLLLDGITQATASSAVPPNNKLTARAAIIHPHMPCISLPTPANCTGGPPGPNIDNLRVAPAVGAVFNVGNGWGGMNRGAIEKHRKLLRQNLIAGQSTTSEGVLGESLAMISSSWIAVNTREQFFIGQMTGTYTTFLHTVGISGMSTVGSSQGPYVDLPINSVANIQKVSRPSSPGYTPAESSAFFNTLITGSMQEAAAVEQTQPVDKNGQISVAASTIKILDIWSTAGTIYDLNDPSVSGDDCNYYVSSVRNNLLNFTAADKTRVETLIGYSASTNTCSTPPSMTQVIVPSNGQVSVGLWSGTGYLAINPTTGIAAIITGGLSGGLPGSEIPPLVTDNNQSFGPPPSGATDDYNNGSPSDIGNGGASWLSDNPTIGFGGAWASQASGGDPVNLDGRIYI